MNDIEIKQEEFERDVKKVLSKTQLNSSMHTIVGSTIYVYVSGKKVNLIEALKFATIKESYLYNTNYLPEYLQILIELYKIKIKKNHL